MIANYAPTATGKVRAVCEWCDGRSRPVEAGRDGQPATIPSGWAVAPFPADYRHGDGSTGSTWTCPACQRVRRQRQRDGVRPLLVPSAARVAARAAAFDLPGQLALMDAPGEQLSFDTDPADRPESVLTSGARSELGDRGQGQYGE